MRLFLAIETSGDVRRALGKVQRSLAAFDSAVRWTPVHQVHLTLKFLGEVEDARLLDVLEAGRRTAAAAGPFELRLCDGGCFPPQGRVNVVWVGIGADEATLALVQRTAEEAFAEIGFAPERRGFTPHLTIGRVREDRSGGRLRQAVAAIPWPRMEQVVGELVLMQSVLAPRGAEYAAVARWPLGK